METEIFASSRPIADLDSESPVDLPDAPAAETAPPIEIVDIAIHVLDHRGSGIMLSDSVIELTPQVTELFASYVVRALHPEGCRLARFREESVARGQAEGILNGSLSMVEGSRGLAMCLYSAMQRKNPAGGDLAIVRAIDTATGQILLAILKLDLQSAFQREITRAHGKTTVRLIPVSELMPEAERRLQKAAFVPSPPHALPYDLMIRDNQSGKADANGAAGFFVYDFLDCELLDGPREFTRKLPQETERWLQEEGLSPAMAIYARDAVIRAINEPEVNLDLLADSTFDDPGRRERFLDHMGSVGFESHTFAPDSALAEKLASSLTYILDGGVRISGDAETIADLLQVSPDPTNEGKTRMVIESFRFERKY